MTQTPRFCAFLAVMMLCAAAMGATSAKTSRSRSKEGAPREAPNGREAKVTTLAATTSNPALADEAQTFDRLVGVWDADFSFPKENGTVSHKKGEILFGSVMDRHAVQDLWIGYPTAEQKERTIGTTFRFFDIKSKQWRIVFVNPQYNYMVTAEGGRDDDRIVLYGTDSDGLPFRSDLQRDKAGFIQISTRNCKHARFPRRTLGRGGEVCL